MEEMVFNFSDERIKKIRQMSYTIFFSVPVFFTIFFLLNQSIFYLNIKYIIIGFIIGLTLIEGMLILQFKTMINRYKETKIVLDSESLDRRSGKFLEKVYFRDIQKVLVIKNQVNEITGLNIITPNQSLILSGFENLELMQDKLKEVLMDLEFIYKKKTAIDLSNPLILLPLMILGSIIFIAFYKMDSLSYEFFMAIFFSFFGIYTIIYKPISKISGIRYKKFEITIGIIMFIFGCLTLIEKLV